MSNNNTTTPNILVSADFDFEGFRFTGAYEKQSGRLVGMAKDIALDEIARFVLNPTSGGFKGSTQPPEKEIEIVTFIKDLIGGSPNINFPENLEIIVVATYNTENSEFSFSVYVSKPINLYNVLELSSKEVIGFGPGLRFDSTENTIGIYSKATFLPTGGSPVELDVDLNYNNDNNVKKFTGDIAYNGSIGDINNPIIGFEWTKDHFKITKFPFNHSELENALNWANQIKDIANSFSECTSKCEDVVELLFDQVVETKFDFQFELAPSNQESYVRLNFSGSYDILVYGKDPIVISLDTPIFLEFPIPSDLDGLYGGITSALVENVDNIASGILENEEAFAKFLSYVLVTEGAKELGCRLVCKYGGEVIVAVLQGLLGGTGSGILRGLCGAFGSYTNFFPESEFSIVDAYLSDVLLNTPELTLTHNWSTGSIGASWNPIPDKDSTSTTGYTVKLVNATTNSNVPGKIIHINNPNDTTAKIAFYEDPNDITATIALCEDPNAAFAPDPDANYEVHVQALASDPDLNSRWGISETFNIPWGIRYMKIGLNFKMKTSQQV